MEQEKETKIPLWERIRDWTPITLVDKMFLTRHLAVMLKGGFPLSKALATLAAQSSKKRFKRILLEVRTDIEGGTTLAAAMEHYPHVFDPIFSNMIRAGEASGKLDVTLQTLARQLGKEHSLRAKVTSSLMYPMVVSSAMLVIGIAMFVFVVPQVTSLYKESNVELPLATRILIAVNDFALNNGLLLIAGIVIFLVLFFRFIKTSSGKWILHSIFLRLPIFSSIVKKINLARFTRILHSLLKTEIPIDQSFQLLSLTLTNVVYQKYLASVSPHLREGNTIVSVLEEKPKLFPPIVTQMIAVGESSGTLDDITEEIALFYEEEVDNVLSGLASVIEPVLILVLGLVAGTMAVAVVMPIYSLVNQ